MKDFQNFTKKLEKQCHNDFYWLDINKEQTKKLLEMKIPNSKTLKEKFDKILKNEQKNFLDVQEFTKKAKTALIIDRSNTILVSIFIKQKSVQNYRKQSFNFYKNSFFSNFSIKITSQQLNNKFRPISAELIEKRFNSLKSKIKLIENLYKKYKNKKIEKKKKLIKNVKKILKRFFYFF